MVSCPIRIKVSKRTPSLCSLCSDPIFQDRSEFVQYLVVFGCSETWPLKYDIYGNSQQSVNNPSPQDGKWSQAESQHKWLLMRSPSYQYFAVIPNGLIYSQNPPIPIRQSLYEEPRLSHSESPSWKIRLLESENLRSVVSRSLLCWRKGTEYVRMRRKMANTGHSNARAHLMAFQVRPTKLMPFEAIKGMGEPACFLD